MSKLFITVALAVLVSACGKARVEYVDPSFTKYAQKFSDMYRVDVNIDMRFSPQQGSVVAVCMRYSNGYRKIQVDQAAWELYDDDSRELMIFHELGHCIFGRDHRDELLTSNTGYIPASIMYPYMFSSQTYNTYKKDYQHELFDPSYSFKP